MDEQYCIYCKKEVANSKSTIGAREWRIKLPHRQIGNSHGPCMCEECYKHRVTGWRDFVKAKRYT